MCAKQPSPTPTQNLFTGIFSSSCWYAAHVENTAAAPISLAALCDGGSNRSSLASQGYTGAPHTHTHTHTHTTLCRGRVTGQRLLLSCLSAAHLCLRPSSSAVTHTEDQSYKSTVPTRSSYSCNYIYVLSGYSCITRTEWGRIHSSQVCCISTGLNGTGWENIWIRRR